MSATPRELPDWVIRSIAIVALLGLIYFATAGGCRHGFHTGDPRWYECRVCGNREGVVGGLLLGDTKKCRECGGHSRVVHRLTKDEWEQLKDDVVY